MTRIHATPGRVAWAMSPSEAHDLGRFLWDVGQRDGDGVAEDGEALQRAAHEASHDGCRWPDDCRLDDRT